MKSLNVLFQRQPKTAILLTLFFAFVGVPLFAATQVAAPAPLLPFEPETPSKTGKPAAPNPYADLESEMTFNLTDADIKGLNLNETEAAELRQFFDALNNLSPAEKQQLRDLGAETEKKMKEKKLDPSNFDDLVKFMEEEEREAKGEKAPAVTAEIEEKAKPVEKPVLIPVASPKDTLTLLKEIERKIESLLVKTKTREALNKKLSTLQQELSEFRYFIKILQASDLVLLLASKEFERLHKNLETLHKALATYEPSILARKRSGDVDDPYEMLSLEYSATPEQITKAYNTLKAAQSPEAVEVALKTSKLSEKDKKKQRKEARLTWRFIQDAYDTLIDPNERAIARKELKNKIEEEARHERTSRAAFDKLFTAFTTAFYPHEILKDIRSLLEKYKPQELELAKKTLEAEKKVAERAKLPVRVETTPIRAGVTEQPYEAFYQKMAQESYMRPQYPAPAISAVPAAAGEKPGTQESEAKKAADKKKKDKEDKEKKEKEEKEKKEKEAKKAAKKGITEKEVPKFSALNDIEKILKEAKDTIEVTEQPKRGARGAKKEETEETEEAEEEQAAEERPTHPVKFETIGFNLMQDVRKPITRGTPALPSEAAFNARQFFDQNRFADLAKALKTLAPGDKKLDAKSKLCAEWKDRIWNPYGGLVKKWVKAFYTDISHMSGSRIDPSKAELYGLGADHPEPTEFFKKKKKDEKGPAKAPAKPSARAKKPATDGDEEEAKFAQELSNVVNLAQIRDTTKAINVYFDNISKACGLGAPPAVPGKKAAKPAGKPKSEEDEDDEE